MQVEKCEICGRLTAALQTCRLCERRVCEEHFRQQEGICSRCYSRLGLATQATRESLVSAVSFRLFLLGFFLMFAGVIVLIVAALVGGDANVSGGVVLIVGFIPIILGAGPYAFLTVLLAVALTIIAFAVFVWMRKQASRG